MDNIAGQKSSLSIVSNLSVLLLVILWLVPTVGLLVSSFRDRDQIGQSGWWASMFPVEQAYRINPEPEGVQQVDGLYVLEGNVFGEGSGSVASFGIQARDPGAAKVDQTMARFVVDVTEPDGKVDDIKLELAYPTGEAPVFPDLDEDGNKIMPDTAVIDR